MRWTAYYASGMTDADPPVATDDRASSAYGFDMSAGDIHWFLAFGRTALTAGPAVMGASAHAVASPPVPRAPT